LRARSSSSHDAYAVGTGRGDRPHDLILASENGYDERFSVGLIASSARFAVVIRRPIAMIIYSMGRSSRQLPYHAGILPACSSVRSARSNVMVYARAKAVR